MLLQNRELEDARRSASHRFPKKMLCSLRLRVRFRQETCRFVDSVIDERVNFVDAVIDEGVKFVDALMLM